MCAVELGVDLRERLGANASSDLVDAFKEAQQEMVATATERFDARLAIVSSELRQEIVNGDSAIRIALIEGFSEIRKEMTNLRVDVLRWSFLFWLGQIAATATVLGVLLRALGH